MSSLTSGTPVVALIDLTDPHAQRERAGTSP